MHILDEIDSAPADCSVLRSLAKDENYIGHAILFAELADAMGDAPDDWDAGSVCFDPYI